jgi:hypothetical protein
MTTWDEYNHFGECICSSLIWLVLVVLSMFQVSPLLLKVESLEIYRVSKTKGSPCLLKHWWWNIRGRGPPGFFLCPTYSKIWFNLVIPFTWWWFQVVSRAYRVWVFQDLGWDRILLLQLWTCAIEMEYIYEVETPKSSQWVA